MSAANDVSRLDPALKLRERSHFTLFHTKKGDISGDFERDHDSAKQWREAFAILTPEGGFQEIQLRSGDRIWSVKNTDFEPLRVQQLKPLFSPTYLVLTDSDEIKSVTHEKIDGAEARCISLKTITPDRKRDGGACVDAAKNTYLEWHQDRDGLHYELSDYTPFAGKLLPQHFVLTERGQKLAEGSIKWDLVSRFDAGVFAVPATATERSACTRSEHPVLLHRVDPQYPPGYRRLAGPVTVGVEISPEGNVTKAQVLETLDSSFDESALDAVRKWTFEPAKCDGSPILTDINVQVNFRY